MKPCTDCCHFIPTSYGGECSRLNPKTGVVYLLKSVEYQRGTWWLEDMLTETCGSRGRFFKLPVVEQ